MKFQGKPISQCVYFLLHFLNTTDIMYKFMYKNKIPKIFICYTDLLTAVLVLNPIFYFVSKYHQQGQINQSMTVRQLVNSN